MSEDDSGGRDEDPLLPQPGKKGRIPAATGTIRPVIHISFSRMAVNNERQEY
jgi:hypothetical protein